MIDRIRLYIYGDSGPRPIAILLTVVAWICFYFLANEIDKNEARGWEEFASVLKMLLEAIGILCIVVIGSAIERAGAQKQALEKVSSLIRKERSLDFAELRNSIIPASYDYGLSSVEPSFNFFELFSSLEKNDEIDIFFTYHSHLEAAIEFHESELARKNIRIRLLISYDRSSQTVRRFREIDVGESDPFWSGTHVDESSAISRLSRFIRHILPKFEVSASGLQLSYRVYDNLPDHPLVIVRNRGEDAIYNVKYAWVGFYLKQAAVRMPAVKWRPRAEGISGITSVAVQAELYFDMRWRDARSVEDMDRYYGSGEAWREALMKAGVDPSMVKVWAESWNSKEDSSASN